MVAGTSPNARRAYVEVLQARGINVQTANDVEVALQTIQRKIAGEKPVALVVIDVGVTDRFGLNLAEQLQAGRARPGVPIVALLPPAYVDGAEQCRRLGIEHCLTKPVKASELIDAVGAAWGAHPIQRAGRDPRSGDDAPRALRVLVADDSPINLEVAAGILALRGHAVEKADSGREAVRVFQRQKFDVILMDVEMPEMDGLQAAAAIREMEEVSGTRTAIFALTAHVQKGFRDRCLAAGMDGYISKPVQPEELFQALEKVAPRP